VEELFDAQLAQSSRVLLSILLTRTEHEDFESIQDFLDTGVTIPIVIDDEDEREEEDEVIGKGYHEYERKVAFQLWNNQGRLLLHSSSAGTEPLSSRGLKPDHKGYSDNKKPDGIWRVFSIWDDQHDYLIQMGERHDIRNELVTEIAYHFIAPSLISLPILVILMWWSIGKAFQPLDRLRHAIANRDPNNLDGLATEGVPTEVMPLVDELNKLFSALDEAFQIERRFTDDAAHELRTPLSALKTQIQVALRSTSDEERKEVLKDMLLAVDRMTHMLNQMLTLARLDNTHEIQTCEVDIQDMIEIIANQLAAKAAEKGISVRMDFEPGIKVKTEPVSLEILLRNLVDNAIHYTPEGGDVSIKAHMQQDMVKVSIADTGPGIDPDSYRRVFERYYRKPDQRQSGSGLGLSIARRCADLLHADLQLRNQISGSGLVITIELPGNLQELVR
jgi:two-component system sensor histidine kinase QseC